MHTFWLSLSGRQTQISDKSCSKRYLVSDVVVIFLQKHNEIIIIGKTNTLLNLINEQHDTDKIYLHARDLSEPKYESLIKKRENGGIKHLNDSNAFINCSNTMDDVYENINGYNPSRKRKILIVFDDIIANIMTNKKFQAIFKELFIR